MERHIRVLEPKQPGDTPQSNTSSEFNQMKAGNLEDPIQKLEELQSMNEEVANTREAMTSVTSNKDHQYVYEILLESSLLLKELSFIALPGQLRQSTYPINPELFLILERTKQDFVSAIEDVSGAKRSSKAHTAKLHRRLVFDLVNEIIAQKMNICRSATQRVRSLKLSGWQLFKDLCAEIDSLQSKSPATKCFEEEENMVSIEDKDWIFDPEVDIVVLDIESCILKNLIDEVIGGGATEKMQYGQWELRRMSYSSESASGLRRWSWLINDI